MLNNLPTSDELIFLQNLLDQDLYHLSLHLTCWQSKNVKDLVHRISANLSAEIKVPFDLDIFSPFKDKNP